MQIENHPFLLISNEIDNLCQPLKRMGIHLFSYRKTFRDGSRINLSNNANWIRDYFRLSLYQSSLFEHAIENYTSGFSLWPSESSLDVFLHGREYYDSDHGITLTLQRTNYCEFFIFGADKANKQIINFYINHLDLLKKFTDYFHDQSKPMIRQLSQHLITLPPNPINENTKDFIYKNNQCWKASDLFETPAVNINQPLTLSERETACAKGVLAGKTAKEIGRQLNLSYRTIEYYIENIKEKTACRNKYELLKILPKFVDQS